MLGETELAAVMDAIYFASHQQDGWQQCLDRICHVSGGDAAQLLMINKDSGEPVAGYQSTVTVSPEQVGDEVGLQVCDLRHEMGGTQVALMIQRSARLGDFATQERQLLRKLMPHIARAMRRDDFSRVLNDRQAAVYRQKQGALLLLDGQQNVVFLSSEAESLLSRTRAVMLVAGRLQLAARNKQTELETLIQRCFGSKASGQVTVKGRGGDGLRLMVSTVQPRDETLFQSHGLVAVFMVSGQVEESTKEQVIGQWLGLTGSESRIASLIAQGRRPADIAGDIELSVHTVRHHIKNIYRKTGAHSQSQLTALVLNLPV